MDDKNCDDAKIKRSKNFKQDEIDLLIALVSENKHIFECKKTDSVTVKDKEKAWKDLAEKFNEISGYVVRDWKVLRGKYENLKKVSKQKFAAEKKYITGTGGGPGPSLLITTTDLKVKEILGDVQVIGRTSEYDTDSEAVSQLLPLNITDNEQDNEHENNEHVDNVSVEIIHMTEHSGRTNISENSENIMIPSCEIDCGEETVHSVSSPHSINKISPRPIQGKFNIPDLRKPPSAPLRVKRNRNYRKDQLDSSFMGMKIQNLSTEKQELIQLQKKMYEEQTSCQKLEHDIKVKNMHEQHSAKMRLLELQIKEKELDIEIKKKSLVHNIQTDK